MNIIIASRSKAVKLAKEIPGAWIISMCDRDSEYVFFGELPRDILFMRFDDEENELQANAPKPRHVESIIDFARQFKLNDTIIVHCEAGICRSSAVAIGVYALHYGMAGAREAFKHYDGLIVPNGLLARLMDEALDLNGELIAVCEGFAKGWDAVKCGY